MRDEISDSNSNSNRSRILERKQSLILFSSAGELPAVYNLSVYFPKDRALNQNDGSGQEKCASKGCETVLESIF